MLYYVYNKLILYLKVIVREFFILSLRLCIYFGLKCFKFVDQMTKRRLKSFNLQVQEQKHMYRALILQF